MAMMAHTESAGRHAALRSSAHADRGVPANVVARVPSDYDPLVSNYTNTIKTYSAIFQSSKVYGRRALRWLDPGQ